MKGKLSLKNSLIAISALFVSIAILIVLGYWTSSVSRAKDRELLRSAMLSVIETEGEKKLFEMAGISVDDIYFQDHTFTYRWNYYKRIGDETYSQKIQEAESLLAKNDKR